MNKKKKMKRLVVSLLSAVMVFAYGDSVYAETFTEPYFTLEEAAQRAEASSAPYRFLDTDGDGVFDTARYCDGYEEPLETYITYYPIDLNDVNNLKWIPNITESSLIRKGKIAEKYPGELQLEKEYYEKCQALTPEHDALQASAEQNILTDVLNSSATVMERVEYLYSAVPIDKQYRNIDNNASQLKRLKPSSLAEYEYNRKGHYYGYISVKEGYERLLEDTAFLKGERPVTEGDYEKIKAEFINTIFDKVVHDPNDPHFIDANMGTSSKNIRILYINGEWYEIYYENYKFIKMTKGFSDNATQAVIAVARSNTRNSLGAYFDYFPEEAKQKILAAGVKVNH
ncbi:MAG: hypothetical protein PHV18_08875 [Lachnospiraceae bacterium]|nr:hypothetical protein [Lachnospiraceae bacterium]